MLSLTYSEDIMHDVDRTLREFEGTELEFDGIETETGENEQFLGSVLGGILGGEMETSETFETREQTYLGELGEYETNDVFLGDADAIFDDVQEMELAGELLDVNNDTELEFFIGKLIKNAGKTIGGVVKNPVARPLGGTLKVIAKKALPIAGAALGNLVVPGGTGVTGGKAAWAVGNLFGLELENLSPQDREFEVARRFVRFAGAATAKAARTPSNVPPTRAVKTAIVNSARRHAPGLLQARRGGARRRSGTPVTRTGVQGVPGVPQSPIFRGALGGTSNVFQPNVAQQYTVSGYDTTPYATPVTDSWGDDGDVSQPAFSRTGRWYRRGRKIVLVGI